MSGWWVEVIVLISVLYGGLWVIAWFRYCRKGFTIRLEVRLNCEWVIFMILLGISDLVILVVRVFKIRKMMINEKDDGNGDVEIKL